MPPGARACTSSPRRSAICRHHPARAEVLAGADVILAEDTRVRRLARPLRHRDPAERLSRAQRRERAARNSWRGSPKAQAVALDLRRRHAADLRSRLQLVREARAAGHAGHRACPAPRRVLAALVRRRACRPTASSSRASCRQGRRRGAARLNALARHPGDAGLLRSAAAAAPSARRHGGGAGARDRPRSRAN